MGLLDRAKNAVGSGPAPKENLSGAVEETSLEHIPEELQSVEEEIVHYHVANPEFSCIILEHPMGSSASEEDKANFCRKVSGMVNMFGSSIALPTGCPLVLFPSSLDRELIAHRLSKSLDTAALLSIEAKSPENVLSHIKSMI